MENTNQTRFGRILTYRMADFDLEREKIQKAFQEAGIEEEFWPNERMPRRAFKKALKIATDGEDFLIRPVVTQKNTVACGLVQEKKNKESKELNYAVPNILTLDAANESISSKTGFRTDSIIQNYKDIRGKIGSTEVALKLNELFFQSMAITILCNKCIFVPEKFGSLADKLESVFVKLDALDAPVQFESLGVDNGTETRRNIVRQFMIQTQRVLDKELDFVLKQRERYETGKIRFLKPTAFKRQLVKVKVIEERIKLYIPLLDLSAEDAELLIQKMEKLDGEINKNIELASNKPATTKKQLKEQAMAALSQP